jgi:hypothetical protein
VVVFTPGNHRDTALPRKSKVALGNSQYRPR